MHSNIFFYILDFFLHDKYKNQIPDENLTLDELVKVKTGLIFSLVGIIFMSVSLMIRIYIKGFENLATINMVYVIILLLIVSVTLIKKKGHFFFNNIIIMLCLTFFIPARILATGGISSPLLIWLLVIPILAMFLFSSRAFLFFSALIILEVFFIYYAPEFGFKYPQAQRVFFLRSTIAGLTMITLLLYSSRKERVIFENLIREREAQSSNVKRATLFTNIVKGMSHNLNNPLSILSISSQKLHRALEMKTPNIQLALKHNQVIENSSDRISLIMKNISIMSRMHNYGESEDYLSVQRILDNSFLKLKDKIEKEGITIINPEIPNYVLIRGIEKVYEEVIIHIVENSIESIIELDKKEIRVDVDYIDSKYCSLIFKDSGPGVDKSIEDQIFDPFFSSKDEIHNVGLGLSLAKSLSEFYDGELSYKVKNKIGQFILKIPRST